MILNERILRLMVVLAEELHFGRASERLHVSQPALSGTLKLLESDLGVRLFKRSSRKVELTEAGQVLANEAQRLIKESEQAVALVRGSSPEILVPLRVGYPASMNLTWLGALIAETRQSGMPGTDVQFTNCAAASLHEELAKGNLHAAFFAGSAQESDFPDLAWVHLFREAFIAALPSRHGLAGSSALGIEQLHDQPVVWLRRDADPLLHDSFMSMCGAQGYRPKIVQEAGSFYECLQFAREEVGLTFVPLFMKTEYADKSVSFVHLPDVLTLEYALAYARSCLLPVIERFVHLIEHHLPAGRY
jgi:LysR family transcriptional regulator, benzoate and cis,cis-muconate-responsive activator of ben and cat genes